MTPELQAAIDDLYVEFAHYPLNLRMTACDCCVDPKTYAALFDGELHDLDQGQLSHFAFQAATTWGTRDDYRHFLPRIFELMASEDLFDIGFEPWLQASKLDYTGWRNWTQREQAVITGFWRAWFSSVIADAPFAEPITWRDADRLVEAIGSLGLDLEPFLAEWSKAGLFGALHIISATLGLDANGMVVRTWIGSAAGRRQYERWLRSPARLDQLWGAVTHISGEQLARAEDAIYRLEHFPPLPANHA